MEVSFSFRLNHCNFILLLVTESRSFEIVIHAFHRFLSARILCTNKAASALAFTNRHCKCRLYKSLNKCASTIRFSPIFPLRTSIEKLRIEGAMLELLLKGLATAFLNLAGDDALIGDDTGMDDAISLLGDADLVAPLIGDIIVRGEANGLSLGNFFDCMNLAATAILEPGLVDKGDPGSCNRLSRLLVSCQNLAETTIPRGPLRLPLTPAHSCNPEVLPEETLSVSDAVRSVGTDESLAELPSGSCLVTFNNSALPKSKLNLPSNEALLLSSIIDC